MVVSNNQNSLSEPEKNLFRNGETNISRWEADEKAAMAASLKGEIRARNNLDFSWHNTTVAILSKKGDSAMDWNSIRSTSSGKSYLLTIKGSAVDRRNSVERIYLQKKDLKDILSPWSLRYEEKRGGDKNYICLAHNEGGLYETYGSSNAETAGCAEWYIAMDDYGYYRIQNSVTGGYLDLDPVDEKKSGTITMRPRKDGADMDQQLWKIEKWGSAPLSVGYGLLDKLKGGVALIVTSAGDCVMDAGGGPNKDDHKVYFGYLKIQTSPSNGQQRFGMAKADAKNDSSPWVLRADSAPSPLAALDGPSGVKQVYCRDSKDTEKNAQWIIHHTQSGAFRFQNVANELYLEHPVITKDGPNEVLLRPYEPNNPRQVFAMIRLD